MDRKQLIVLIALAAFIFVYYQVIMPVLPDSLVYRPKPKPPVVASGNMVAPDEDGVVRTGKKTEIAKSDSETPREENPVVKKPKVEVLPRTYRIETDFLRASFDNRGGILTELAIKDFHPSPKSDAPLILVSTSSFSHGNDDELLEGKFETLENGDQILSFRDETTTKTFVFKKGQHSFNLRVEGVCEYDLDLRPVPTHDFDVFSQMTGVVYNDRNHSYADNSAVHDAKTAMKLSFVANQLIWSGYRTKYFVLLASPGDGFGTTLELSRDKWSNQLLFKGEGDTRSYQIFVGPASKDILQELGEDAYQPLLNYTGIDWMIHLLLSLLEFFHVSLGINMGVSILMLTVLIRGVLLPLNLKAQSSMFMMSQLAPDMKLLQEKYKNDRQMLAAEQMKLWKGSGVNPMSGCLPMFIQMPVFISLFSAIGEGFTLRHAPFVAWIQDLSRPDGLMVLHFSLPFGLLANVDGTTNVNVLVFLYIITMVVQQSMMPKSTDPQQQQMQKMMKVMMFVFAFILYNYSSGLMVYWVGSNCWSIAESWYIRNRIMPRIKEKFEKKKKS